jgi:hypothetical protein
MYRFTDQRGRLRRIVENALAGATYKSSHQEEESRLLAIEAVRGDGQHVVVRFRGVRDSEATQTPQPGAAMKLLSVGSAARFSILSLLVPFIFRTPGSDYARVRIGVGAARLDIVCQDAEWWEVERAPEIPDEGPP